MSREERIFNKTFEYYIRPSTYEKMISKGWFFERFHFGFHSKSITLRTIKEYLDNKISVKCGYMATSVRGYHEYYIISKHKL